MTNYEFSSDEGFVILKFVIRNFLEYPFAVVTEN